MFLADFILLVIFLVSAYCLGLYAVEVIRAKVAYKKYRNMRNL